MLCDWLAVGQVIATNPATIDCFREVQPAMPKVWSWPVPACEAGATKVPFADRSNIVYRPLSANIGNGGSRP